MGGSFDPIHTGHLMVASFIRQEAQLDKVLLVISPDNPLKPGPRHSTDIDRMAMTALGAFAYDCGLEPCTVEMEMPRPSYTIDTLRRLQQERPNDEFTLIIGADNWAIFDRWRDHETILRDFDVIVYPRQGYPVDTSALPPRVRLVDAPIIGISSTDIRRAIAQGRDVHWFVPAPVADYIAQRQLYTKITNH